MRFLKYFLSFVLFLNAVSCLGLNVYAEPIVVKEARLTIPELEYELVSVEENFGMELLLDDESVKEQESASFVIYARCTAYCSCRKCCGKYAKNRPLDANGNEVVLTTSGARAIQGTTVGVDSNLIPLGSRVVINGHTYIAQDTGNPDVVKDNVIDIYFDNHDEALAFGVQYAEAQIFV